MDTCLETTLRRRSISSLSEAITRLKTRPQKPLLWKIGTLLQDYPVARSSWYQGDKDGKQPNPVRIDADSRLYSGGQLHLRNQSFG